jgi:hypothetical protein
MPDEAHIGLTVRRHERHEVALPATVRLAEQGEKLVRFNAAPVRKGSLQVQLVDVGRGGVGFKSEVFLPRECAIELHAHGDDDQPLVSFRLIVRRVQMISREPVYLFGTSFTEVPLDLDEVIARVVTASSSRSAAGKVG